MPNAGVRRSSSARVRAVTAHVTVTRFSMSVRSHPPLQVSIHPSASHDGNPPARGGGTKRTSACCSLLSRRAFTYICSARPSTAMSLYSRLPWYSVSVEKPAPNSSRRRGASITDSVSGACAAAAGSGSMTACTLAK